MLIIKTYNSFDRPDTWWWSVAAWHELSCYVEEDTGIRDFDYGPAKFSMSEIEGYLTHDYKATGGTKWGERKHRSKKILNNAIVEGENLLIVIQTFRASGLKETVNTWGYE